jgi:hypothetical protein
MRALRWLPTALLVAVALVQIALARGAQLSGWSGGGFGMFATTDAWARRHLHAWAIAPGIWRELEVPEELEAEARRAVALPTEERLRALALRLAEQADPRDGPLEAIELQVFATRYDPVRLAPSGEPLRSVRVELGQER